MPGTIWGPILLRALSALVFVIAVIVAGASNRSILIVPMLAGAATLANLNTPRISIRALAGAPEQGLLTRILLVFGIRTLAFGVLFGLSVLIAALFRETELAREFTQFDTILITVPFALAMLFSAIAMRSPLGDPQEFLEDLQKAFVEMQSGQVSPHSNDDGFTVDGEFEDLTGDDRE